MAMNLNRYKTLLFSIFILLSSFTFFIIYTFSEHIKDSENFIKETMMQEAVSYYNSLVTIRKWNASFGGVYAQQSDTLKPNKYLENNQIITKDNKVLVKINPALMTRQISEISNQNNNHYFKITSLDPINPINKADDFEREALEYFDKYRDKKYYTKISEDLSKFDFMGSLKVTSDCLQCHAEQGYQVGDIRGGIRVSIPTTNYLKEIEHIQDRGKFLIVLVIILATVIVTVLLTFLNRLSNNSKEIESNLEKIKALKDTNDDLVLRYERAIEGSQEGLWDWNLLTNDVYFSKRWKSMLGYKDHELKNRLEEWDIRVHPDDKEKAIEDITANHNKETKYYENIHRLKHKDGSWVWILDRGKTYFDKEGNPIRMIGFHSDITKLKNLESELKEKEELMLLQSRSAAMGEMISMIAHQWRQPITTISMSVNNIIADIELEIFEEKEIKKIAENISSQTEYLSKTIDDFRNFFKKDRVAHSFKLRELSNEISSIILASIQNSDIELDVSKIDEEMEIFTYKRELLQVLLNIIKNAKEAFEQTTISNKKIKIEVFKLVNNRVKIVISDNAGGIKEENLDRVFDAYFTTKEQFNGTGLGLYMSKMIVEKHLNGKISAYNSSEGAVFEIVFTSNSH